MGLLHGRGTVCPIRSDRYCTPPYNLHGLMTSITLLRASAALRTARVVHSLGHGPDTRFWRDDSCHTAVQNTRKHSRNTAVHPGRQSASHLYSCRLRGAVDFAAHPAVPTIACILLAMRSRIRRAKSLLPQLSEIFDTLEIIIIVALEPLFEDQISQKRHMAQN